MEIMCSSIIAAGSIEQEVQAIRKDLVTADYGEYMNPFGSEDCLNNEHEQCSLWSDTYEDKNIYRFLHLVSK